MKGWCCVMGFIHDFFDLLLLYSIFEKDSIQYTTFQKVVFLLLTRLSTGKSIVHRHHFLFHKSLNLILQLVRLLRRKPLWYVQLAMLLCVKMEVCTHALTLLV